MAVGKPNPAWSILDGILLGQGICVGLVAETSIKKLIVEVNPTVRCLTRRVPEKSRAARD
ncbi:hypothetical protein [Mesorhizobium sangaii]|uniref:Uncharacterized protein n=1 Tax=Mesorhizobium sangaii TaxID=505389 RepID=A0A841PSZ4_9HYPH|nr:hypothetical protein [Mesorhizobium sangaii]MBB6413680.1 hypothetical protein [Mesorhizobium sangaii]